MHSFTVLNAVSATVSPGEACPAPVQPCGQQGHPRPGHPTRSRGRAPAWRLAAGSNVAGRERVRTAWQGAAQPAGARDDPRRLRPARARRPLGRSVSRRWRDRGVHRRRTRHQQPGLHPRQRAARVRRLQGLQRRGHRRADRRRGGVRSTRVRSPRRAARSTTWRLRAARRDRHLQHPHRGRRPGREPRRTRHLRRRGRRLQLLVPAGHRLRGRCRPRQRAQRVAGQQLLPRRRGEPRRDQAGQRQRGGRRDDGDGFERRRRRHQHDRHARRPIRTSSRPEPPRPIASTSRIGYGGAQFPGIKGYLNNDVSSFSSGGFEQDGRTIDVVAPGRAQLGAVLDRHSDVRRLHRTTTAPARRCCRSAEPASPRH